MAARLASSLPMPRPRLVEGSLGTQRSSFLQVLLDLGFLVEQVEVGAGAVRDDLGAEDPGGPVLAALADHPAEDDVHLVRAADARGLSRISCSKKIRPDSGRSRAMVVENSTCPSGSC